MACLTFIRCERDAETNVTNRELPSLARPPITEVVCGIRFRRLPALDPLLQGRFWSTVASEFPKRSLNEPLSDPGTAEFWIGPPRVRSWFTSADDAFVVQVQDDRFYLNWRRRGGSYPRFGDHEEPGVLSRALKEFERFSTFCGEHAGGPPQVEGIELAKINILFRGEEWETMTDIADLLPATAGLSKLADEASPEFQLSFQCPTSNAHDSLCVVRMVGAAPHPSGAPRPGIHFELRTRPRSLFAGALEDSFLEANAILNGIFESSLTDVRGRFGLEDDDENN